MSAAVQAPPVATGRALSGRLRPARPRARPPSRIRSGRYAPLYLAPALLIFLVFIIGPAIFVLFISFFNWDLLNASMSRFVGGANYAALVASAQFWQAVLVSVYFVGVAVTASVAFGLGIALLLSGAGWLRRVVRLAVLTPYFTPVVATSIVWIWIFNPQFGLLDSVLHIGHLPTENWLESVSWALPAVIVYTLWHNLGFTVVIFLAGLATVSRELREAARVDGASGLREIWHVVLPQLSQVTLFVVVITTIDSLQAFTQFYTMTQGGPLGSTTTIGYLLYQDNFVFYHTGTAAAIAVVLFAAIVAFTLVQLRLARRNNA
ncbi:MAG: carbohydrate ABC transporter permease [Acidimicrobiales bacterium]